MGNCISDVEAGKQAVGAANGGCNGAGQNDAVDMFYRAHGQQPLFSQLELSLSASKLLDLDILSKSDPMAVVYMKKREGVLEELGRTEVIMNCLNPVWIVKIAVTYHFEILQHLVFRLYDVDTKYHNIPVKEIKLNQQEFLGEANCILSEIITKRDQKLTLQLHKSRCSGPSKSLGTLTVRAEETLTSRDVVEIVLRCTNLDNKDILSKTDPFLRISKLAETGESIPIYKTETVNNNLNPTWKPVCLTTQQFGSKDAPLVIECFDFNRNGNHTFIGKVQKSISELEKMQRERSCANLSRPHRGHQKVLKGQLFVDVFREKQQYSFIDYISSGFELNFLVAVDFTASNGNPRTPNSLHYIDPSGRLNAYQLAIREVGGVIQFYDSDKRFPAWGFGARTMDGSISHCFPLNAHPFVSEVEGVDGIMAAYASALHNVALAGPTLFGRVINRAAEIAGQSVFNNSNKYYILLIITDGVLTDIEETIDALVRASDLPLSVLIVGVGGADFTQMEILDADNRQPLQSSSGRVATRDIVQFVPMRDVHGQISIVEALLEELPGQFLTYMRSRDIKPLSTAS